MKLYFDDELEINKNLDEIHDKYCSDPNNKYALVFASHGYQNNMNLVERLQKDTIIVTNCLYLLSTEYGWNEETNSPEIYIKQKDGSLKNISELTQREIRQAHNIEKMYMAGEFDVDEDTDREAQAELHKEVLEEAFDR